jgi:hypothetical protein
MSAAWRGPIDSRSQALLPGNALPGRLCLPEALAAWTCHATATVLILAAAALHIYYLTHNCPLDLAPDEAHYWDWSRHLDWSYYSKGPLVAWLIRTSLELLGGWSRSVSGSDMPAVRMPAVLSSALMFTALYLLTLRVYQRPRLALLVVACGLTIPLAAAGASLMTIDAPYTCCWAWGLVLGYDAAVGGKRWAWLLAGAVVGLGILAKYTMILWLVSFFLFLAASVKGRPLLRRPGFWLLATIAGVFCLPIVFWNYRNGWVTFQHVGGQAGVLDSDGRIRWLGPLEYVAVQCAIFLIFWFIAYVRAMAAHAPWKDGDFGRRYLWWMSAPTFVIFFFFSLKTPEEPNWPIAAYLSGLVLAAGWLADPVNRPKSWDQWIARAGFVSACVGGLLVSLFMHHTDWARPLFARISGPATEVRPLPLRRFDPTCRLRGWHTLATALDAECNRQRERGIEPVLAGDCWNVPGEIGFYCHGQPAVYSIGLGMADRHSQYDFWHPNPIDEPENFRGRTFIVVGDPNPFLRQAFDRLEPPRVITYQEAGAPLARWTYTVCHGYRGFAREASEGRY